MLPRKLRFMVVGILQVFRGIRTATRGLIAAPWTPLASLCCRGKGVPRAQETESFLTVAL